MMAGNYALVSHSFFSITALIGSQLLNEWTVVKSGVTLFFFILYAALEDEYGSVHTLNPTLRRMWLFVGHALTFIVVRDMLTRVQDELRYHTPSYAHIASGFIVVVFVLPLYRFNPIKSTYILRTVLYTIALHFSGILLVLLTQPTTTAYVVALVLNACALFWLYFDRAYTPCVADVYRTLLRQVSVFFIARWAIFVYQTHTQYQHVNTILSFLVIIAMVMIFTVPLTRNSSTIHVSTTHAVIESFVFFLSFTFVDTEPTSFLQLLFLLGLYASVWFVIFMCKRWLVQHKEWGTRTHVDYLLGLLMRVLTYIVFQLLVPFVRRRLTHDVHVVESITMYCSLALFASHFVWRTYSDTHIDLRDNVQQQQLLRNK